MEYGAVPVTAEGNPLSGDRSSCCRPRSFAYCAIAVVCVVVALVVFNDQLGELFANFILKDF